MNISDDHATPTNDIRNGMGNEVKYSSKFWMIQTELTTDELQNKIMNRLWYTELQTWKQIYENPACVQWSNACNHITWWVHYVIMLIGTMRSISNVYLFWSIGSIHKRLEESPLPQTQQNNSLQIQDKKMPKCCYFVLILEENSTWKYLYKDFKILLHICHSIKKHIILVIFHQCI